jgi:transposase InsO family protein
MLPCMPWKRTDAMTERTKLVLEWEKRWNETEGGRVDVAELARLFGVSRQTAYVWIRRYRKGGHEVAALEERSRRPHHHPKAISESVQDFLIDARKAHPRWGPRKLRAWLVDRHPGREWPSASCIAAVLKRRGLSQPRKRRRREKIANVGTPFAAADRPNAVWCVDFKGWFRTEDGNKCYPLTIVDAYSRFLVRCEVLSEPNGRSVRRVFDSAFQQYGLPAAIRSDNGPPFASTGPASLTTLSVWWLRLGIRLERIAPGKPQQNGRQERFHRTLKLEVPPQRSLRLQQRAYDLFRAEYNEERPHEALGQKTPASIHHRSPRQYPRGLERAEPPAISHHAILRPDGSLLWHRRKIFISTALANELIGLLPSLRGGWDAYFGPILLGRFDEARLERGLVPIRRSLIGCDDQRPLTLSLADLPP